MRVTASQWSASRSSARSSRGDPISWGLLAIASEIVPAPAVHIPRWMGFRCGRRAPIESRMLPAQKPAWLPLGALLVREGLITNEQLELALMDQQGTGLRLGELLVQWGWVESSAISRALAEQYEMEFVDLDATEIDSTAARLLTGREARHYDA